MKRILILTASFGEGHNSAARGIRDGLAQVASDRAEVEMHDLFAAAYGPVNEIVRRGYLSLISRAPRAWAGIYNWLDRKDDFARNFKWFGPLRNRLAEVLARLRPDVVVSVFPAYGYFLDDILGRDLRADCKRVICVTDSITVNAIWYRCTADCFLVPNEESARVLRGAGINDEIIRAFGFPVNPKFAELTSKARRDPMQPRPRLLYMISSGTPIAPTLVRKLVDLDVDLTVTVGHDQKLRRDIENALLGAPRNSRLRPAYGGQVDIVGWTLEMPRLLVESDLLISKAGGATVQETIAAACPMIVNQVVPGQEEGNARLIVETNSGAIALSPDEVVEQVRRAFANNAEQWREWHNNIRKISRPCAALDIAEFLLAL